MKEAASIGGLNTPTLPTNYLPRATPSFCMTCAITEKPRAIAIVTVQKVSHMGYPLWLAEPYNALVGIWFHWQPKEPLACQTRPLGVETGPTKLMKEAAN
jgi:hypothetical protein